MSAGALPALDMQHFGCPVARLVFAASGIRCPSFLFGSGGTLGPHANALPSGFMSEMEFIRFEPVLLHENSLRNRWPAPYPAIVTRASQDMRSAA
ncbi:hypothetical protein HNQ60_002706 [Povalibacter uvarum]|uniref:Uncharacterized protein n=1 Tax=Povalibacter uvarum TaxID=732238 RepID=A0A841HPH5_9GAMM|nr:hypothetical protein [Povalibacter uvarum]